jgi:hypothetical protein
MSPFRWDVLLVGFVLALPVLALGLRGDLSTEEMMTRLPWYLGAGWGAVALLRWAVSPPTPVKPARPAGRVTVSRPAAPDTDDENPTHD